MLHDICLIQAMFSLCEEKQCDSSKLWWFLYLFFDIFSKLRFVCPSLCLFKRADVLSVSIFLCVCVLFPYSVS